MIILQHRLGVTDEFDLRNGMFQEAASLSSQVAAVSLERDQITDRVKGLQATVSQLHSQLEAQAHESSSEVHLRQSSYYF